MVILLGGSSHVGKTLCAQRLVEKYHWSCTSLDHIKMGFIRSGRTELTVNDDYQMRYWLWPFVREMVKTAIENDQDLILEGCYIPSEWKESFSEEYLREIRTVFLVMSERYLRENFSSISEYANVIEHRLCDVVDKERLISCSREFMEEAERFMFHYIEIDSAYDIDRLMEAIVSVVEHPEETPLHMVL